MISIRFPGTRHYTYYIKASTIVLRAGENQDLCVEPLFVDE
jgi:hypothetical protein